MKHWFTVFFLAIFVVVSWCPYGLAEVELVPKKTLRLDEAPVDACMSSKGTWTFVLTDQGRILVYSAAGELKEQIDVGRHVDGIKAGTREEQLLLTSREQKTVQVISLDFIFEIDVSGAPSQGPDDAPVVIAVFNDFQ